MRGLRVVFNYGSNSTAQLRGRLNNPFLQTQKALVKGYTRTFEGYSRAWQGSVASLAQQDDGVVHGSVVELTEPEQILLDQYEGSYNLISVIATIFEANGETFEKEAQAYVISDHAKATSNGSVLPFPSEQYLCSVSGMMAEHWTAREAEIIKICTVDNGTVVVRGEWTHPHALGQFVSSLESLAVELNLRKEKPWKMPYAVNEFAKMALIAGIQKARDILGTCLDLSPSHAVENIASKYEGDLEFDLKEIESALAQVLADSGFNLPKSE